MPAGSEFSKRGPSVPEDLLWAAQAGLIASGLWLARLTLVDGKSDEQVEVVVARGPKAVPGAPLNAPASQPGPQSSWPPRERPTRGQGPGRHRPESPYRSPRRRSHRDRPAPRPAARHRPLLPLRPAHDRVRPAGSPLCDRCRTGRASRRARPPARPSRSGRRRSPVTRWPDLRISVP